MNEANESFFIALSSPFTGTRVSPTNGASTVTIADNDAPPSVSVPASVSVDEGTSTTTTTTLDLLVTLSATSGSPVTVSYATADGTATNDPDYVGQTSTITIAAGNVTGTIAIEIVADAIGESNETFTVTLTNATTTSTSTSLTITQATTTVTIDDDDAVTVDVPMGVGFNLIAVPVKFSATATVSYLAAQIEAQGGVVTTIVEYDAGFNAWLSQFPTEKDFLLQDGRGYFVRLTTAPTGGKWTVQGLPYTTPVTLGLGPGFNLISVPKATPPAGYDSRSLAEAIDPGLTGIVSQIVKYDAGFTAWLSGFPTEKIFAIEPVRGYFVRLTQAVTGFVP